MKRKIYEDILKWKKESNGTTALLIEGARRVGKSYIAEKFAKCSNCGEPVLPHTLCSNCGYYDGKQIVVKKDNNE